MKHFSSTLWLLGYYGLHVWERHLRNYLADESIDMRAAVALVTLAIWLLIWDRIFKSEKEGVK